MKHLLLVLVVWAARLVAGLPRFYYIDKDSASILQKPDLHRAILARRPEDLIPKLVPRAGPKGSVGRGNPAGNSPKAMPPDNPPSSKQAAKATLNPPDVLNQQTETVTTRNQIKGKAKSQSAQQLPAAREGSQKSRPNAKPANKQQNNPKQRAGSGSEPKSQQIFKDGSRLAGKSKTRGGSQSKSKSIGASALPSGPKTRSKSRASALGIQGSSNKRQGRSGATAGRKTKQQDGLSKGSGLQKGPSKMQMRQGLRSQTSALKNQRMTRSKTASAAQTTGGRGANRGKSSVLDAKEETENGKNAPRGSKRAGGELASKSSKGNSPKKRICRRADGASCSEWDIEQGLPPPSQDAQSRTSSAPLVPPMITSMSRTGREYARANPWTTATYALSASSAALGNAAGVTDHCCNEECAKSASHVLNYCGMAAGVAGAAAAFTGATIQYHNRRKEKEEQDKRVEQLTMKTEGHDAAIEDHGRKIEQTDKKFSSELKVTKQTVSQLTQRLGGPKPLEDVT